MSINVNELKQERKGLLPRIKAKLLEAPGVGYTLRELSDMLCENENTVRGTVYWYIRSNTDIKKGFSNDNKAYFYM